MKSDFIVDLADGQMVASLFLVREKEIRTSVRSGKSWLELRLADRTGTIPAKMWDNFTLLVPTFECHDVIQIRGRVKLYNGQKELTIEQIIPAAERDYDLGDFLPHTKYDVEKLYACVQDAVAGMKNPWLKQLLSNIVGDPAIAPQYKRAPAAMMMHHAYIGGLLEHVVSLIGLAAAVSTHYPDLDADLLLTGVVLHDVGKIDEFRYARGIDYSEEGRLLGHIMIGTAIVREKINAIAGFPAPLATAGRASYFEPSWHARIRLAFAAADSRSRGAQFHRRYRFENGGHAREPRLSTGRRAAFALDRSQSCPAPGSASRETILGGWRATEMSVHMNPELQFHD